MGDDCLSWAIKNGELARLKDLVENQGINVNAELNGRFPLHYAADYGQSETIEYLICKGAEIDKPDKYGITALLSAIFEGHTECVKLLLEKGASKTGKGPSGESYIECAEKDEIKQLLK